MHRRLTELLGTFNAEELKRLGLFLHSPYFNQSKILVELGGFYLQYAPEFEVKSFTDTRAFEQLFPGQPFQQSRINKYHSLLYELVKEFLLHESVTARSGEVHWQRLASYDARELNPHFKKEMDQATQRLDKNPLRNAAHYYHRLQLARLEYAYLSKRDERDGDIGLQVLNDALDVHFIIEKIRHLSRMIARERAVKVDYQKSWVHEIQDFIGRLDITDNPSIRVYQSLLLLQLDPKSNELYQGFKEEILELSGFFTPEEQRELFTSLENMAKYSFSPADYPNELFSLYQRQLETQILTPQRGIHHSLFRNIISVAIHVNQFAWAKDFLERFSEAIIPKEFREDVCLLCQAELEFYQSRPAAAILTLQRANPRDVYYKLTAKTLQARAYYQLRELDVLDNFLNTFTKFIYDQQKRISQGKVKSYRSFINYLRRLTRIVSHDASSSDQFLAGHPLTNSDILESLHKLQTDVKQEGFFMGCNWLLAEIGKLKPG